MLTEIVKKKKAFEDKKKELDEQTAAALAEKKSRSQKETKVAPSESEVDLGVFRAKPRNLLEEIYKSTSGSRGTICPFVKEDDVEVEQVGEGGGDGVGGGDGRGGGVDTEVESSEATPRHTIYTKRPPGYGGDGTSGVRQGPEFEHVQGGSWDTQNPAYADLPHAPRWSLTQGSRMTDLNNCREFFSLSLPPAERLFQKRCHRIDLLEDHIHVGVNFFSTSQEIAREWQLMGEDKLEFEAAKKVVADAEDKLAKEKQLNVNKQKEWEIACERTNRELQTQRDTIVRLLGEKTKISNEAEQERAAHQKRESKYLCNRLPSSNNLLPKDLRKSGLQRL
ncbi:hypothetical protein Hanom_Chr04g00313371 [Helianthus anomalus]